MPPTPPRPWAGLSALSDWPEEPPSPRVAEPDRLGRAVEQLCDSIPARRARRYAVWMIESGRLFGVDPFLTAAVIKVGSHCIAGEDELGLGLGLGRIDHKTHARQIKNGRLRYSTLDQGEWRPHELRVDRFPFTARALLDGEASIYFLSALLHVDREQCASIDAAVSGERHRHFVSHHLWGDRVLGTRYEELVLEARRRLLQLYEERGPAPVTSFRDVLLGSPLDGVPRQVSSRFRDLRPNGRRHRGIDLISSYGEAVRAVADGVVMFAGIGYPRGGVSNLSPAQARRVPRRAMGIGGLFVLVDHGSRLKSGYFHLASYTVRAGDRVQLGEVIGFVGDTGIKESSPHLHFELRVGDHKIDPARPLLPYLVPARHGLVVARPST